MPIGDRISYNQRLFPLGWKRIGRKLRRRNFKERDFFGEKSKIWSHFQSIVTHCNVRNYLLLKNSQKYSFFSHFMGLHSEISLLQSCSSTFSAEKYNERKQPSLVSFSLSLVVISLTDKTSSKQIQNKTMTFVKMFRELNHGR